MEIPKNLLAGLIAETKVYFFENTDNVGIPKHLHICVKKTPGEEIYLELSKALDKSNYLKYIVIQSV